MRNDDLERLEESQEIRQLIRSSKEQYEQEKSEYAPAEFASLMDTIRKRQNSRMKSRISPWWLTAACLLGWIVGYGFSGGSSTQHDYLVATDTIIIIRERVDTIYWEVQPESLIAGKSTPSKSLVPKKHAPQQRKVLKQQPPVPVLISPEFLQRQMHLPNPESECYAVNGMTVADDNYPLHLLVAVP